MDKIQKFVLLILLSAVLTSSWAATGLQITNATYINLNADVVAAFDSLVSELQTEVNNQLNALDQEPFLKSMANAVGAANLDL